MVTNHHHAGLEQLLGTVGQAMTTRLLVLDADTPADVAARQLAQGAAGAAVLHRGRVVGVVTLDDLLARPLPGLPVPQLSGPVLRHERLLASLRVWQLIRTGPLVAAAEPLVEAARLLDDQHLDVLAVVDGHGRPVGIIGTGDLIHALARYARADHASADRGAGPCRRNAPRLTGPVSRRYPEHGTVNRCPVGLRNPGPVPPDGGQALEGSERRGQGRRRP